MLAIRTDQNRYGFHSTGIWVSNVFIMDAPKTIGDDMWAEEDGGEEAVVVGHPYISPLGQDAFN